MPLYAVITCYSAASGYSDVSANWLKERCAIQLGVNPMAGESCDLLQDGSVNGVAGGVQRTTTDDEAFYRATRDSLEVDQEGIELSSAPVTYGDTDKKGKGVVRRVESDDAEGPGEQALKCQLIIVHFLARQHI